MNQEKNIKLYMGLRLVMLFSVLVSTILYARSSYLAPEVISKTFLVTFFTFLVTTAFVFLSEKTKAVSYFLTSQILYDILFTTVLIFYTGSTDSMYTVFYFFNIIFAAILFRSTGALVAALLSGSLYLFVNWLNAEVASAEKSFSQLTLVTAFVAIALLAGQLIEEIRKGRQKITRLEKLSEEIVESLDCGLLGIDSSGKIQKINRTGQKILNISDVRKYFGFTLQHSMPDLSILSGSEVREIRTDGRKRRMLLTKVELPEGNAMILFRDLTEVLDLEEGLRRQERLAGIGRLAAGVAHEIRNPIASISGAAQILSNNQSDAAEAERLLKILVRESERVDRLVAQLLKFAKPKAVIREEVDLKDVLTECVESIKTRPDFANSGINLNIHHEGDLKLVANRDEVSEVVTNLLTNAYQALLEKKTESAKRISVDANRSSSQIELTVTDNGPGIPREFRERVFDPFFTTKSDGTGLGLAQVHKIVRDHEGHVDVESEEGHGTTMKVRWPASS